MPSHRFSRRVSSRHKNDNNRLPQTRFWFSYEGIICFRHGKFETVTVMTVCSMLFLLWSMGSQHLYLLRQFNTNEASMQSMNFGVPRIWKDSPSSQSITNGRSSVNASVITNTDTNINKIVSIETTNTTRNKNRDTKGKYAYAMLMAGVDPETSGLWYHGILFNAMVTSELLHRNSNSQSDVILMVQLSKEAKIKKLSDEEEDWLRRANVIVKYIPLPDHGIQNFYTIQFEKFRVLQYYKEYSRIIFMDGDVMPNCNLDYIFKLSEEGVLKENMVIAWRAEPSSGGFFMLHPKEGDYENLEKIIERQQQKASETGILFDLKEGWGHNITSPDRWKSNLHKGTDWKWHGNYVDQGLLYFWVKYYKKNVSILIMDTIEQYGVNNKNEVILETTLHDNEPFKSRNCDCRTDDNNVGFTNSGTMPIFRRIVPFRDYVHFTGKTKPWMLINQKRLDVKEIVSRVEKNDVYNSSVFTSPQEVWQFTFWKIHERLQMGRIVTGYKDDNNEEYRMKRMKIFHDHLRIPNAVFGGHPKVYHANAVIAAKFGRDVNLVDARLKLEA